MAKYIWPASGLKESDMALLHHVRESRNKRVPITKLLAQAVRETYGHLAYTQAGINQE